MPKKPVIFKQIGKNFEDVFNKTVLEPKKIFTENNIKKSETEKRKLARANQIKHDR